jgi:hypothetical protein
MADAVCLWCEKPFKPPGEGSHQRFRHARHRIAFHTAASLSTERAVDPAAIADLGNGAGEPCRRRPCGQSPVPLPTIGSADPALVIAGTEHFPCPSQARARVPRTPPTIATPMRRNELRSKIPTGQRQTWRLKSSKPDRLLAQELVP